MADNVVERNERRTFAVSRRIRSWADEEFDSIVAGWHVEIEVDGNRAGELDG